MNGRERNSMATCPHADIRFCPLYIACHIPNGGGCDDGDLGDGGCAVDHGMNYDAALARLNLTQFALVANAEYQERQETAKKQRLLNMCAAGLVS